MLYVVESLVLPPIPSESLDFLGLDFSIIGGYRLPPHLATRERKARPFGDRRRRRRSRRPECEIPFFSLFEFSHRSRVDVTIRTRRFLAVQRMLNVIWDTCEMGISVFGNDEERKIQEIPPWIEFTQRSRKLLSIVQMMETLYLSCRSYCCKTDIKGFKLPDRLCRD